LGVRSAPKVIKLLLWLLPIRISTLMHLCSNRFALSIPWNQNHDPGGNYTNITNKILVFVPLVSWFAMALS